ncbi:MAG: S-adenosylmethionine:tRNA ribosyltransferase-isomerase [Flavobacteriales bacterium]
MNCDPRTLRIEDFDYHLPDERISRYALPRRDESRLLVFDGEKITDRYFRDLPSLLTKQEHVLVSNNTRVIPARIHFAKSTGGIVEIFCLEPNGQSHQDAMMSRGSAQWKCLIGGAKKWKGDQPLSLSLSIQGASLELTASIEVKLHDTYLINFNWPEQYTFSAILDTAGKLPLPPYLNREAEAQDYLRYQTIFAKHQGSVAAPTAALHFTDEVIQKLNAQGIAMHQLTLHVGAGTFKPVSAKEMGNHYMHEETFSIGIKILRALHAACDKQIVAVGTTSMRTLESLYWLAIQLKGGASDKSTMHVSQWAPYHADANLTWQQALALLIEKCESEKLECLNASTAILIAPGYQFKACGGLVTNFHMPKSTLLLLVAAFTGEANWKGLYHHAMEHQYRFLSYGDSSLLLPNRT